VAIWSQKGGVGRSTVTALLGLSLRDLGKKVGLLDVSGSSLHKALEALGLLIPPRLETSTARRKSGVPHCKRRCSHLFQDRSGNRCVGTSCLVVETFHLGMGYCQSLMLVVDTGTSGRPWAFVRVNQWPYRLWRYFSAVRPANGYLTSRLGGLADKSLAFA
jgi:hypothetical protein